MLPEKTKIALVACAVRTTGRVMAILRDYSKGAAYFFTVVTQGRRPILTDAHVVSSLREAMIKTRESHPFKLLAYVVLPDHMHMVWQMPENDADYSLRWSWIKRLSSQSIVKQIQTVRRPSLRARNESGIWQRRFWDHRIRDHDDFVCHIDYIHNNPVKHGYIDCASMWALSSFHAFKEKGWIEHYRKIDSTNYGE